MNYDSNMICICSLHVFDIDLTEPTYNIIVIKGLKKRQNNKLLIQLCTDQNISESLPDTFATTEFRKAWFVTICRQLCSFIVSDWLGNTHMETDLVRLTFNMKYVREIMALIHRLN